MKRFISVTIACGMGKVRENGSFLDMSSLSATATCVGKIENGRRLRT
jgi:hypothetical protein